MDSDKAGDTNVAKDYATATEEPKSSEGSNVSAGSTGSPLNPPNEKHRPHHVHRHHSYSRFVPFEIRLRDDVDDEPQ